MIHQLNDWLAGKPDTTIKIILASLSTLGFLVVLYGTPALRLFLTGWFLFP